MKLIKQSIKGLIILLFSLLHTNAFSQKIHFTCFAKTKCLSKAIPIINYSLSNGDTTFFSDNTGICYVDSLGIYTLYSTEVITGVESPQVCLTYFGNVTDTIQTWALYPIIITGKKDLRGAKNGSWLYCGDVCEGYKVDYYDRNTKRVEGNFKNGRPIGKLKFYDNSGMLKYIEHYNKQGRKLKSEYIKK